MSYNSSVLNGHVRLMGTLLGEVIGAQYGHSFFQKIEKIRTLSKAARVGDAEKSEQLLSLLNQLKDEEILPVVRAFSQFLNLANIAEQYHAAFDPDSNLQCLDDTLNHLFLLLKSKNYSKEEIKTAVEKLQIELVLTAHPTEITRRTLIQKYTCITECLHKMQSSDSEYEKKDIQLRLKQLIWQSWHTNEMRHSRPTPIDEVKWGMATVESSLWQAVPDFIRILNDKLFQHTGYYLSTQATPIRIASWIGGDRDGNPNVIAKVTRNALTYGRYTGAVLYLNAVNQLISELSMNECSGILKKQVGDTPEPYRALLSGLRTKLENTRDFCRFLLEEGKVTHCLEGILRENKELITPLQLCYDSLCACGLSVIADGPLLDLLRRARSFGIGLVRLDIRQEADRHTSTLSELTQYLGLGDYTAWSERDKQTFLLKELSSPRPLIASHWQPTKETQEVLDTFLCYC